MKKLAIFLAPALPILLAIILSAIALPGAYSRQNPPQPARYSLHVVRAGDTLWGLSERYMPGIDPRQGVEWILEANGMPGDYVLQPGDLVNVPDEDGAMPEPMGPTYSSREAAAIAEGEMERVIGKFYSK